jgi:Zn-dependent protease with chaperone function
MRFAIFLIAATVAWGSEADVTVQPTARGDVELYLDLDVAPPAHLSALIHAATGCDLPANENDSFIVGTCRHMLPSRAGLTEGSLSFATLVLALRAIGEDTVQVNLRDSGPGSARPLGAGWVAIETGKGRLMVRSWEFVSNSNTELPPPVEIRIGRRVDPRTLLVPLLMVLFVPGLLALWLDHRRTPAALVWLNWIMLASWLYWISAVDVNALSAFAGTLDISAVLGLIMGAAFFSIPPLVSSASCLIALAPRLLPGANTGSDLSRLLKRTLAGSAATLIPLGIFLVGIGMFEYGWQIGMGSVLAAYLAYRAISWQAWRWSFVEMRAVDRGEFFERVAALAHKAQVKLRGVYILRNRLPREANAFAMPGGNIAVTESLLRSLNKREVDAVMAHELGHVKGRHVSAKSGFYWAFFILAGPAVDFIAQKTGLPDWTRVLPIAPSLFVLAMAYLSQRHEFSADARAAEITGDPKAKICALARLARLTSSPLDWGGIQGSILSHPSMKARVLSIARGSGLPSHRALELLENPDLLESGPVDPAALRYSLPPELENHDPAFNTTTKLSFLTKNNGLGEASIVILLFSLAYAINRVFPMLTFGIRTPALIYLACMPAIYYLIVRIDDWMRVRFYTGLRQTLTAHISPPGGEFVGLLPGHEIVRTEGCGEWDLGYLFLAGDRLVYRGERTEFSLARWQVHDLQLEEGPFSWSHPYRVVVGWAGGWFSVQRPDIRRTRREGRRLLVQMEAWRNGFAPPDPSLPVLPPPVFPAIRGDYIPKLRVAWWVGRKFVKLIVGCSILDAVLFRGHMNILNSLVIFTAPLLWLASAMPNILARRPGTANPVPVPVEPVTAK